jgi:predicted enzyme related to lactoylglutathione lyase
LKRLATAAACAALLVATTPRAGSAQAPTAADPGSFGWCELLTYDGPAAAAFYGGLFGWSLERHAEGKYRLLSNGVLVGGITQITRSTPEVDEGTWLVGITVRDVRASVNAAREGGGKVLRDVARAGRKAEWAVVEDGQGAQVLLFEGGDRIPTESVAGHWIWSELWTTDPAAAAKFYKAVVGWTMTEVDHPDGPYPLFQQGDVPAAGVVGIDGDRLQPGWAPYVGVDDLATTLTRARQLGGEVLLEPGDDVHGGRVAVIADPTGVPFLVYQLDEVSE